MMVVAVQVGWLGPHLPAGESECYEFTHIYVPSCETTPVVDLDE